MAFGSATRLRLHVVPGARDERIVGRHGDAWKVRVTAAPERGAANGAALRLLAATFELPARAVRLVSGHGARDKIVEVAGIAAADAETRLASASGKDARR